MNGANPEKDRPTRHDYTWVWEILILATVTPALVHGVLALNNLPLV